jgi:hypothetical protein
VDGWKNIVKITPHSVHSFLGYENGVPMFQTRFHTSRRDGRTNSLINLIYEDTFAHLGKKYGLQSYRPAEKYSFHLAPQEVCASASFNPDADPESTSVDGTTYRGGVNETFATIRSSAGTASGDNWGADSTCINIVASGTTDQFDTLRRAVFLFDISSLAGATISAADYKLHTRYRTYALGHNDIDLVESSPASNTALVSSDYNIASWGSTLLATSVNTSAIANNAYTTWTINASGVTFLQSAVDGAGIAKLGLRMNWDTAGSFGGVWQASGTTGTAATYADAGSNEPTLDVTYAAASTGMPGSMLLMGIG